MILLQGVHDRYMAGESLRDIAAERGYTHTTLSRAFHEAGYPLRPRGSHP